MIERCLPGTQSYDSFAVAELGEMHGWRIGDMAECKRGTARSQMQSSVCAGVYAHNSERVSESPLGTRG